MKLKIKRIDKTLPIPTYQTPGSVAFDLYSRITIDIPPQIPTIIPTNIIVKIPKGYFLMLASRSSLPLKKHLMVSNSIGVIDQDYCGDKDEIGIQVINFSNHFVNVERGERIAQAILVKIGIVDQFIEEKQLAAKSRGGWGSTK